MQLGRYDGLMVNAVDSRMNSLGSRTGLDHSAVFSCSYTVPNTLTVSLTV